MNDTRENLAKKLEGLTSNVNIIKFIVYYLGPVAVDDVAAIMAETMFSFSKTRESVDHFITPILGKQGYYQEEDGKWTIIRERLPEHKVLPEILARERRPLYEREMRSRIATALGCKVKEVCIELDREPALKRFNGRWGLKDWQIVNDEVVEILRELGKPLTAKELMALAAEKLDLPEERVVFDPRGDRRFLAERKAWGLREWTTEPRRRKQPAMAAVKSREAVDLELEQSFLKARSVSRERERAKTSTKVKLKKAAQQQAKELLRERTVHVTPIETDLATQLSEADGTGTSFEATSFSSVEASMKERSLSSEDRDEILAFVEDLMEMEDKSVGVNVIRLRREPLSSHKILSLLKLKYLPYFTERVVIPDDYYSFAAELVAPHPGQAVLNPAAQAGEFAMHLLTQVFERLAGAAWAPHGKEIEVVQRDGVRYRLAVSGTPLEKKSQEDFLIAQTDLLDYFLVNNFAAVEMDRLLAQAARHNLRLSGFPNVYLAMRDFLTQLPEVFGEPPNENNQVSLRFDLVFGNFTFLQSHNLAANYLDEAVRLLERGGIGAFFVLKDMMRLLKGHDFLRQLQDEHVFRYLFDFPQMEGAKSVLFIVVQRRGPRTGGPPLIASRIKDIKALSNILVDLAHNVQQSGYYEVLNQDSVARLLTK